MVMTKSEALKILEIAEGSTQDEIRASYKKLALRWHPDKHSNSAESTKKFQEISEAYKRLTSKEDDDDIRISMADMFDLFAHIFFSNNGYFAPDNFFYSDDEYNDEYDGYNDDDYDDDDVDFLMFDSDDDFPIYRSRQHHAKYSDMMARRVSKATANSFKQEILKKKKQVRPEISEEVSCSSIIYDVECILCRYDCFSWYFWCF
ncbi:chaperone protein DnaJ-like isoform X1 [Xenia sp. Carnegie-2017]|uniref:chaperone protein DnaJ-like isoform X1 n=1 Tax=Xenia sp. Carnegie-2017 TaxID=2897299 RepID=UPI001F042E32|nr:chaperone protein DnaJ-like isoform X1 [Xenia sp. Carnegie-2017]